MFFVFFTSFCFSSLFFFFFKQKTAYEIYQCDWSSDVCSSDLHVNSSVMNRPSLGCAGANRLGCMRYTSRLLTTRAPRADVKVRLSFYLRPHTVTWLITMTCEILLGGSLRSLQIRRYLKRRQSVLIWINRNADSCVPGHFHINGKGVR